MARKSGQNKIGVERKGVDKNKRWPKKDSLGLVDPDDKLCSIV